MRYLTTASLLAAASLTLTGCLEREEKIAVKPDGSATITLRITGDKTDFEQGDAMPSAAGGWHLVSTPDPAKPEKIDITATRAIPAGQFPGTFATTSEAESISLKFPTEVWIEDRSDGRYYQFRRVYHKRTDAPYTLARRELQRDPKTATLLDSPPAKLTDEQRTKLIEEFKASEIEKQRQFILAGMAAIPQRPQDTGLRILAAATASANSLDTAAALKLLTEPQSKERDQTIEKTANDFFAAVQSAIEKAIDAEHLTPEEESAFQKAMAHEKADRAITEDINDEGFKVELTLPGEIVASNGQATGSAVSWSFDGFALMDRDEILMATSRVRSPVPTAASSPSK
ncbi:MAG: hypothetical protein KF805_05240 [Phycisphaeraceae bacterium]|nr:hypothetical protein [Phycisphaeraceae bacterium]